MNEKNAIESATDAPDQEPRLRNEPSKEIDTQVATGIDDAAAIPKGEVDPVYEAKARVLNRAACCKSTKAFPRHRPSAVV